MGAQIPKTLTRLKVYLVLSFLLSLFLFFVGVNHNLQGEFIDLDTNWLDLGYTAVFMSLNIATVLAIPLTLELVYLGLSFLVRRRQPKEVAVQAPPYELPMRRRFFGESWQERLVMVLSFSFVPSLLVSGVAMYAAYRHNPQEIYFDHETRDIALWACARFFLRCFIAFSIGLAMVQLALLPIIILMTRFGDRLRARTKIF